MDDVKPTADTSSDEVGMGTPQAAPQQPEQTPVASDAPVALMQPQQGTAPVQQERTIPYSRFAEVNKNMKDAQRQLAELRTQMQSGQYSAEDVNQIMAHPYVQDLLIQNAKYQLTDYAKELLGNYPTLDERVKKAILSNVRGFVKETTTDIESAKLDILDYIEGIVAENPTQQVAAAKSFQVAPSNAPVIESKVKPAEIEKILKKPLDEWSEEEMQILGEYTKSHPQK
jgi:hypothetical protein